MGLMIMGVVRNANIEYILFCMAKLIWHPIAFTHVSIWLNRWWDGFEEQKKAENLKASDRNWDS
jgi:hypothetical protein